MRKIYLMMLLGLLSFMQIFAQIITTSPAIITKDYTGEISIIYDAAMGTAGLKDYAGSDGIYAHTGVITDKSTSDTDWKSAPAWGDNSSKYRLTAQGNNKYKLVITPNMTGYYNLTATTGTVVKKMAFVFRNGLKTKEGKDTGGKDIFVTVFDAGLNVIFTNPTVDQSVTAGTAINLSATSSLAADLTLYVNQTAVANAAAATTISKSYTFTNPDDYTVVAAATSGSVTVYDTVRINVPAAVVNQARPAGVKNGINYNSPTSVTLVLHAPNKSSVFAIGEFNDWLQLNAFQLKKDGDYWWITLDNLTPGRVYGYQYLVDNTIRISDPYTELVLDPWNDQWINYNISRYPNLKPYPTGKTDGLVATFQTNKPAYNWEVPNFPMPNRENMVIYELLVRDFTVEKTLSATIGKLDYLKTLGINAIELMPIQEFDGNESWGYNPNHFFAPDKFYGSPEMYKKFVDECHKRGIAVIVDMAFNHSTGINPMAKLYWNATSNATAANNPWFNVTAPHPYSVFHDFNHEYSGTREFFKRVVQYWIQEYKIDGFRMDLTKGLTQRSSTESTASNYDQSRIDILTDYYNAAKAVKSDVMFILEHFCNYDEELELANRGMYLWRNANNSYSQAAMGFSSNSDFGGLNSNPRRWVGYAESHDEERNFYKAKAFGAGTLTTDSIARVNRVPLNIAFTSLMPGPKMIWQFGEMGFDYSINALGGRTSNKPSAWTWLNLAHRKAAYDMSSRIISLRSMFPKAFTEGNYSLNVSTSDWENGRRIALTHSDLSLVVLGNFKADGSITSFPNFPKTGMWYNVLTGQEYYVGSANNPINLTPGQVLVFADKKINFNTAVEDVRVNEFSSIFYPVQTSGKVFIQDQNAVNTIKVMNLQGQLMNTYTNTNEIDLSAYAKGIYMIIYEGETGKVSGKIMKF